MKMLQQSILKTDGYHVTFDWIFLPEYSLMDAVITFSTVPGLQLITAKSDVTYIRYKDMERLIKYFQDFVAEAMKDSKASTYVFVPSELGFNLQPSGGEIVSSDDGCFSLTFMVNIGRDPGGTYTYVGGESLVDLVELQIFLDSLQEVIDQYQKGKGQDSDS